MLTREHSGATAEYCVGVQVLTDVNIAFHDGVVSSLVNTGRFHSEEGWLVKGFGASEPFVSDSDDL